MLHIIVVYYDLVGRRAKLPQNMQKQIKTCFLLKVTKRVPGGPWMKIFQGALRSDLPVSRVVLESGSVVWYPPGIEDNSSHW